MNTYAKQLGDHLEDTARRIGLQLEGDAQAWREYAAERMLHLSGILDQPGYLEAVTTEAVNVALKAAGSAVDNADAVDRELIGVIAGGLVVGARALAGAPG